MKELVKAIAKYIEYLRLSGVNASVHFSNSAVNRLPTELFNMLLPYNVHTNPYCMWVKRCDRHKCIESQQELIEKGIPCVRVCHAGVKEYIVPFSAKGENVGIISVSGYRNSVADVENTELWRNSLICGEPPVDELKTLIIPLTLMLEKLFEDDCLSGSGEYNRILQYLSEYYLTADLDSVCRHFHRSPSHISHMFKKSSGMSIRAYCNRLKLLEAEHRLTGSDASVTTIAMDCGFNDVSHFINLFRKKYGVSPLVYRKNIDKSHNVK